MAIEGAVASQKTIVDSKNHGQRIKPAELIQDVLQSIHKGGSSARIKLDRLTRLTSDLAKPRLQGLPDAAREEALIGVLDRLTEALIRPHDTDSFFVNRFELWVKRQAIDEVRLHLRQVRDARLTVSMEQLEESLASSARPQDEFVRRLELAQALIQLEPKYRDAIWLYYLYGYPVHSNKPGEKSLCSLLGIARRTAHNRLNKGITQLKRSLQGATT